jgi:hypothetical protein
LSGHHEPQYLPLLPMTLELEMIESFHACRATEMVVLMRRLVLLKASVSGLSESQLSAWQDVRTRAEVIQKLLMIETVYFLL